MIEGFAGATFRPGTRNDRTDVVRPGEWFRARDDVGGTALQPGLLSSLGIALQFVEGLCRTSDAVTAPFTVTSNARDAYDGIGSPGSAVIYITSAGECLPDIFNFFSSS